jgi:hypothetical protein
MEKHVILKILEMVEKGTGKCKFCHVCVKSEKSRLMIPRGLVDYASKKFPAYLQLCILLQNCLKWKNFIIKPCIWKLLQTRKGRSKLGRAKQ